MFLSREHRFRGAPEILRALNQVHDEGLDINAFVMGTPIDMGDLPHVHHPPLPQAEFAALLGEMDIFIHASHFEGLPLPPLEAMACGCAVITTDIGASDYLLDGFNALVVPPKKPAKIAEAVRLLAADGEMRIRLRNWAPGPLGEIILGNEQPIVFWKLWQKGWRAKIQTRV